MPIIQADVSDTAYRKLKRMKEMQGYSAVTWGRWLTETSRNVSLDPQAMERVHENTRKVMLKLWMRNFAENLPRIRDGKTIRDLTPSDPEKFPKGKAIVLGRGPSIFSHKHLDLIAADGSLDTFLVATDGIMPEMLKQSIIPDLVVTVDGSEELLRYYDVPGLDYRGLKVAMVTQANPKVVQKALENGMEIYWWLPMGDLPTSPDSITYQEICMTISDKNPQGVPSQEAGGNAGTAAWVMSWALLRRSPIALTGFDFGYPTEFDITKSYYYSSFIKYLDPDPLIASLKAESVLDEIYHPVWSTRALIDPVFKGYREALHRMLERLPRWVDTWNCTEGGTLWHDRLKCKGLAEFLALN